MAHPRSAPPTALSVIQLDELRRQAAGHPAAQHSIWDQSYVSCELDPAQCRADNAFVWQRRVDRRHYEASFRNLRRRYPGLSVSCREDGACGPVTYEVDGQLVSRDLLDSIAELAFLERHLVDLHAHAFMEVGAGYGRLAHRMLEYAPGISYLCCDAVPESTLICRSYLAWRGHEQVEVPGLGEVSATVSRRRRDVLINVHSFPEMPLAAIEWWIALACDAGVGSLFLVPNEIGDLRSTEPDGSRRDFAAVLHAAGFGLEACELKYPDDVGGSWLYQDEHRLYRR